ncbi:unnamed protein product [Rotaria sp. Silwood2]|nr:unnamed protein product [Rotaria sp. Silwood2]
MSLELLANELILDLFKFLTCAHLIHTFVGLNSRFDALGLNHFQTHGLDLRTVSKNDFDTICRQYLMPMINRISTLCLSDKDDTPGQINRFHAYDFTLCDRFWLDEHCWFVQCDWNPERSDADVYTLPFAFSDFEFVFPNISKSTCPTNNDQWPYDCVRRLTCKADLSQYLSDSSIQFFNIQDLSIELPVNHHFCSMVPKLNRLRFLRVSSNEHSQHIPTQLQTLLNSASHLFSLTFNGSRWLNSSFEFKSETVSQLKFDSINAYYNQQQCTILSSLLLGIQCEALSIAVENRECIVDVVNTMINLRALHVQCHDNKLNADTTTTEDELVKWLQHRLSPTLTRQEGEELVKRVCNIYEDLANQNVKTTVNYSKKRNIPERTLRYMLKKYLIYGTTEFLPSKGRPVKITNQQLNRLVKAVNNKTDISQRQIVRRHKVHHTTISRPLR